jgi:hypothetical protein
MALKFKHEWKILKNLVEDRHQAFQVTVPEFIWQIEEHSEEPITTAGSLNKIRNVYPLDTKTLSLLFQHA